MIGGTFKENGPLEGGIEASFSGTGWGVKDDFRWILGLNACIFEWTPLYFPKEHTLGYQYRKFRNDHAYIRRENYKSTGRGQKTIRNPPKDPADPIETWWKATL